MAEPLLLTTVVGSYPQPNWLVDKQKLKSDLPARIRMREVWRVDEEFLEEAMDDATILAIRDMERAGVDIISDGEIRRESYMNRLSTALDGIDIDNPAQTFDRHGLPQRVPRVVGPIRRTRPVQVRDAQFLRANTDRKIKMTLPGPFTLTRLAKNEYYPDDADVAMAYAEALNEEIKEIQAAGVDVIQLDEPYLQGPLEEARRYAIPAINRALEGVSVTKALHTCFGYAYVVKDKKDKGYSFLAELEEANVDQISIEVAQPRLDLSFLKGILTSKTIVVGVLDLGDPEVEPVEVVAERIRAALKVIPPERLMVAPDCGMKYIPRDVAFGKLKAMVEAARLVRQELMG